MSLVTAFYISSVVAANLITANTGPVPIGPFLVTWGTFLIGATLVLRDFVQLRHGCGASYQAILVALVLSAVASVVLHDPLAITGASAIAFAFSEIIDTELFTRVRSSLAGRIFLSGTVSGLADSAIFVVLGLSPLTTGFVPWAFIPSAIVGQYLVKTAMTAIGATVSLRMRAVPVRRG